MTLETFSLVLLDQLVFQNIMSRKPVEEYSQFLNMLLKMSGKIILKYF